MQHHINVIAAKGPTLGPIPMRPTTLLASTSNRRFLALPLSRRRTVAMLAAGAVPCLAPLDASAEAAPTPFDAASVRARAQALAQSPYRAPAHQGGAAAALDYDGWRRIAQRPDRAYWRDGGSLIRLQYFPTGYIFKKPVELYEVADGQARPIAFDPSDFDQPASVADAIRSIGGVSGFRLQSPINTPEKFDEIAVFQGASYFRGLGRDQAYGLSSRGISLGTGEPNEEFPDFRAFWVERPVHGVAEIVVHALLDGPSLTGAYRFRISTGRETVFDIEASLFPRRTITHGGLAAQSSMFLFGAYDRKGVDDFRPQVHDSDGLEIHTQEGGRMWRPLTNPDKAQISTFDTKTLLGFGLCQRASNFEDYSDLEARYDRRPSLWVEPKGDWGPGAVHLLEMPARDEGDDNIACFWRPAEAWRPGVEVKIAYRLTFGRGPKADGLAWVNSTRAGQAMGSKDRQFVVDFADLPEDATGVRGVLTAGAGKVGPVSIAPFPDRAGVRAGFRFTPPASGPADLELRLVGDNGGLSEAWRFRWI